MKNLNLLKAVFAMMTILMVSIGVTAQVRQIKGAKEKPVIVVLNKDNKLEFAMEKPRLMEAMQQAFKKVDENEVVRDIDIRTFEKVNYLAVGLEDRKYGASTLFIQLEPVGEGTARYSTGPHVVTCVQVKGCAGNCVVVPPNTAVNPMPSPACRCWSAQYGYSTSTDHNACNFKINKSYISELIAAFDGSVSN
ncbi:MAG TPA: hypothetical protein VGX92_09385 [Pyrinomonadaceae bacterium]|jgi:hypothetical protein|nr:hypothetical protein [Pyrinomonadaceae bacterium]